MVKDLLSSVTKGLEKYYSFIYNKGYHWYIIIGIVVIVIYVVIKT